MAPSKCNYLVFSSQKCESEKLSLKLYNEKNS